MQQPATIRGRLRAGDGSLLTVPVIDHPVTTNELHTIEIGFPLGVLIGRAAVPIVAVALSLYALLAPSHEGQPIGLKTITREPWWFITALIAGYQAGTR